MISELSIFLAQAPAQSTGSSLSSMLVPMMCIGVIFYFLIIRPQNKRQKDLLNLVSNLKTGDSVVTTGGIHGIISNVKEGNTLLLKVADNVKIEIDKSAIASVDKRTETAAAA
ncbi:MAG TPA: preprotein translocase subunit YajC [Chthoniobacteraceae bacterium]|jgi:preprotein translocase subunit YajC|nr:preprotein translocase, YajC subunit [Chthoniobacter sp.]HEV7867894.1 preprotein translocase subunit YajC [Chthoniobacteraceae bacterium]